MAEVFSTVAAGIGLLDLCLKYGQEIHKLCSAFQNAVQELQERALMIENHWFRCATQLDYLKMAWSSMTETHKDLQERTLRMFHVKLTTATTKLQKTVKLDGIRTGDAHEVHSVPRRFTYAFQKGSIDAALEALDYWQRMSDPTFSMLMQYFKGTKIWKVIVEDRANLSEPTAASTGMIPRYQGYDSTDQINIDGLLLRPTDVERMQLSALPLSCAVLARSGSKRSYVLDHFSSHGLSYERMQADVGLLATKLRDAVPETCNLLQCKGFIEKAFALQLGHVAWSKGFTMVLKTPPAMSSPRSLRYCMVRQDPPASLSTRFTTAQQLARSVSFVHAFGFVHKNISPESILLFDQTKSSELLLFLIGFGAFRHGKHQSAKLGDDDFKHNLYRHRSRQGLSPEETYTMLHDIYSLGVCLLEIGLWRSLIDYDDANNTTSLSSLCQLGEHATAHDVNDFVMKRSQFHLLDLAETELKACMGTQYSELTTTCLTCLEPDSEAFGEFKADDEQAAVKDGLELGFRYIEEILHRLNSLSV